MNNTTVGASILNIITESLYDKPIVVFREYVQNSADSLNAILSAHKNSVLFSNIWTQNNNLYFLDNGIGINPEDFLSKMQSIAFSGKDKETDIGYKGIGRLSGISYCNKLHFINIIDFENEQFQEYTIDCVKYTRLQKSDDYNKMTFEQLMLEIGTLNDSVSSLEIKETISKQVPSDAIIVSGFLVILENITTVLQITMDNPDFRESLNWLLPVPFKQDLLTSGDETDDLFKWLSEEPAIEDSDTIAAQAYTIYFNGTQLFRPLNKKMFRTYLCKSNFEHYAVCIQSFSNEKIEIDKNNAFSGIRIYIDNMLLCDENELIPILQQYGFTTHTSYELIQSVRGMGVMIYIIDKVNISANARRTFIELTDTDSLQFLQLIATLVENIYSTRYALSKYYSAMKKGENAEETINELRKTAQTQLEILAKDEIVVKTLEKKGPEEFINLSTIEQKRAIKSKLTKGINDYIKQYLNQTDSFNLDTCLEDFKTWLLAN